MTNDIFEFEAIPQCPLCATEERYNAKGVAWLGVGFCYSICAGCGMKYMNPRPTEASYQRFYRDQYWQQNLRASGFASVAGYDDPSVDQMELRMGKYRRVYRQVEGDLRKLGVLGAVLGAKCRVLEVGCAFGFTLEWLARDHGCQVFGIEPSSEAVARCEQGGVPILARNAEDLLVHRRPENDGEKFDVILFRHCLESIVDPVEVMRGAREFLAEDGVLCIYTVNVEFNDAMDPYHPFLYSPQTLHRLLALCGLEVQSLRASPSPTSPKRSVEILHPSYESVAFARRGEPRKLPLPDLDVLAVARTIEHGQRAMHWRYLSARDLLRRLLLKLWSKARQAVGGRAVGAPLDRLRGL